LYKTVSQIGKVSPRQAPGATRSDPVSGGTRLRQYEESCCRLHAPVFPNVCTRIKRFLRPTPHVNRAIPA